MTGRIRANFMPQMMFTEILVKLCLQSTSTSNTSALLEVVCMMTL